jgi:hypothetical protein
MASFVAAAAVIGASSAALYFSMEFASRFVDRTLGYRGGDDIRPDVGIVAPDHPSGGNWRQSRS